MNKVNSACVSVIIPCYNCKDTIHRAVNSVFRQTWRPAEIILVDDASTDGTPDVLLDLKKTYGEDWIKVILERENKGPGSARNTGWDMATQPYVAFLDADDSWHPKKIEIMLEYMSDHPEVAMVSHKTEYILDSKFDICNYAIGEKYRVSKISFCELLFSNRIRTSSVILKRDIDLRFESGKRHSEDYLLWLLMVSSGLRLYLMDLKLVFVFRRNFSKGGISDQLWNMEKGELDTYRKLWKMKRINFFLFLLLIVYSLVKFLLRILKSFFINN